MENRIWLTKVLAISGTTFVWLPVLAPLLFGLGSLAMDGRFRFDYLMPAEFYPIALVGGVLLFWAAYRSKTLHRAIGLSFVLAVAFLAGIVLVSTATGLATGETAAGGWEWFLLISILAAYTLSLVAMGIEGAGLLRRLFGPRLPV